MYYTYLYMYLFPSFSEQNNVLELWSLFDFLMPGFLGTEKQFIARFAQAHRAEQGCQELLQGARSRYLKLID